MATQPEFSRLIAVDGISPDKVRKESLVASKQECAALAKRFDVRELSDLKAELSIRRVEGGDVVRLEGRFSADVVQTCVVSLQDVHGQVKGHFETYFSEEKPKGKDDLDLFLEDDDSAPEVIRRGNIDLGEVVSQYLALELDPYPRAPGVSLAAQLAEVGTEVKNNPFRVLQGLKEGKAAPAVKMPVKTVKAAKPAKPKKSKKGKAK